MIISISISISMAITGHFIRPRQKLCACCIWIFVCNHLNLFWHTLVCLFLSFHFPFLEHMKWNVLVYSKLLMFFFLFRFKIVTHRKLMVENRVLGQLSLLKLVMTIILIIIIITTCVPLSTIRSTSCSGLKFVVEFPNNGWIWSDSSMFVFI